VEMQLLQSFISRVRDLIFEGVDPEEVFKPLLKKRLNCLAC